MAKPAETVGGLQPYPAYKPSRVEWLGEVPAHWEAVPLKRVGWFCSGAGFPVSSQGNVQGEILYAKVSDMNRPGNSREIVTAANSVSRKVARELGAHIFPASTIVFPKVGGALLTNKRRVLAREACIDNNLMGCVVTSSETEFVFRLLQWLDLGRMAKPGPVPAIGEREVREIRVPLPPLPEQTAIARYLDHADWRIRRCIRGKQKLITLLEEQKQAIIHQAVTGRIDVQASKPYPSYKNSGVTWLGEVPEHWKVIRLGRLITLTTGFPFKSEGFTESEGDVRLLRGINVAPGRLRWEEIVRWPTVDTERFAEYELQPADIVLGMDRPIVQGGIRVALVDPTDVPSLLLQRVARIRPGKELIRGFAFLILNGRGFSDYLAPILTGVSVPHLSPEQIKGFRFALPSLAEQGQILEWLSPRIAAIRSAMNLAMSEILLLREYRARLISDVVTGKLDVREGALRLPNELEEPEPLAESGESAGIYAETSDELDALTQESEI